MSQVRNVSGNDRYVPALGCTVKADEVADVPDELLEGLVCQVGVWEDTDAAKKKAPAKPRKKAEVKPDEAVPVETETTATLAESTTADAADTEDH